MPILSAADLVDALRDSRILDSKQLDTLNRSMKGSTPDPRAVARELVKRGWVTTYQANLLYQGRSSELVLGEYLLLERLGEGGMGQVFKARHQLMNRIVALKVIAQERLANPELVQRFRQEIQAAAKLSHPNIVTAYDAQQFNGTHCLVMEYVEGSDLQSYVQKHGRLPVGQACAYVSQAASGLQHAATHLLVHRDIKPSNLQMTADGQTVKILDFGLARLQGGGPERTEGLTQAHTIMGTPDYIAPEQVADPRNVDSRADIYSLGCTLYFLLAGQPPFAGAVRWEEKLVCHSKSEPPPLEQFRTDVPPALGGVLRKMMAKQVNDRYPTPAAVAEALSPFGVVGGPAAVVSVVGTTPNTDATTPYQQPGFAPVTPISSPTVPGQPGTSPHMAATVLPTTSATVPNQPNSPFTDATVLAPPSQPSATPVPVQGGSSTPNGLLSGKKGLLAGVGLVLVALVVGAFLFWPSGDGSDKEGDGQSGGDSQPKKPKVFVDEDFKAAYKNKLNVPKGWTDGEAFRVVNIMDEPCLEVGLPRGVAFVTLPPVKLKGDFYVEGAYVMSYNHKLTFRFENRKTNAILPIILDATGAVVIADDPRSPLPGYKPYTPTKFTLTRKGSKISIALNGDVAAVKDVDEATEFTTIKLGLTAGHSYPGRLFRLKIGELP